MTKCAPFQVGAVGQALEAIAKQPTFICAVMLSGWVEHSQTAAPNCTLLNSDSWMAIALLQ
ncbi:hypothetical protein ACQ4M4_07935 [Leptolyngbya sp. AN02str]|uniref:hypothetical protein n=1 Tax=Leptolyngbya sp. AN02str TaxID=3423363 RepID=UPI003D319429